MKRILIFSLAYYPKHIGGAEVAIKEITDRISPDDIEFHMVTNRFDGTLPRVEMVGNVLVHRIGLVSKNPSMGDLRKFPLQFNKYLYQFTAFWKAHRLHAKYHYDGIWAMMAHSTGTPAGMFKTFYPKVKYLLTLQEGDPPEYIEQIARPVWSLFKRGFTKADELQGISNFLIAWGKRMGFWGEGILIPNGTDVARFSKSISHLERTVLRQKWEVGENETVLVSTSRLVHKNAMDDVIRALVHLPKNIQFINFGFGPDKAKLERMAQEVGVLERVQLLDHPGLDILPKYLHACDIFIRPSRSEGMGISFVEAMAAELPVIATQEGGIADFLFDEKRNPDKEMTGWAVDTDSPKQIAKAVKEILSNSEKTKKVIEMAKKLAIEKYDWDIITKDMKEKVFDKLLKGEGTR